MLEQNSARIIFLSLAFDIERNDEKYFVRSLLNRVRLIERVEQSIAERC